MTAPNVELCPVCQQRPRGKYAGGRCNYCYKAKRDGDAEKKRSIQQKAFNEVLPKDLLGQVGSAKTTQDWQDVASKLGPTIQGILNGDITATAAQAALIKDIMNRAYGKPVATQSEREVASGVLVLPALSTGESMTICPKCGSEFIPKKTKDGTEAPMVS